MRVVALISGLVLAVVLCGCVPPGARVGPSPEPSVVPVFASEEEALAAAEQAYAAYLAVSDAILQSGGEHPERIEAVATGPIVETELAGFEEFRASEYRSIGNTTFGNVTLQMYDPYTVEGDEIVRVYLCSDVSGVDVVDSSGASIVSADRPNKTAFEAGFDLTDRSVPKLALSSKEVWTGASICE